MVGGNKMTIEQIVSNFDCQDKSKLEIQNIKNSKKILSSSDKKYLRKKILKFRTEKKENILKAVIVYSIWDPKECIDYCRKKGLFRYQMGRGKISNAEYYLHSLIQYNDCIEYPKDTLKYLETKESCKWMYEFYIKTEGKIKKNIEEHHKRRIRKNINGKKLETALFKELIVYLELLFTNNSNKLCSTPDDKNLYTSYTKEEIGEGISYIIYLYDSLIGIKEDHNYWVDTNYIFSKNIEDLILLACQYKQMQQWEVLIDYFGYTIIEDENKYKIIDNSNLEKSIRLGYSFLEMHDYSFFAEESKKEEDICSLKTIATNIVHSYPQIMTKHGNGFLERYIINFPENLINLIGKEIENPKFFLEEVDSLNYSEQEMTSEISILREKKITEHTTIEDILFFQRFFILIFYIQNQILRFEKNKKIVAASIGPVFYYDQLQYILNKIFKNPNKVTDLLELFTYNKKNNKLDLQYTPIIRSGNKLFCSPAIITMSNMIRNAIENSYMIKNKIVNNDEGLEPLVKLCKQDLDDCSGGFKVFSNLKYTYSGAQGEIDILAVSDTYILIIECKAPIRPTNNFEMRSQYTHIFKAKKQLDLSKNAFSDKGFRKKFLKGLGVKDTDREIITCILLDNSIFSGYTGCGHPIRAYNHLKSILKIGKIGGTLGSWRIWNEPNFSIDDLIQFLSEDKSLIRVLEQAMENRIEEMKWRGKIIQFETYRFNILKAFQVIDKTYVCLKKEPEWNQYMEEFKEFL